MLHASFLAETKNTGVRRKTNCVVRYLVNAMSLIQTGAFHSNDVCTNKRRRNGQSAVVNEVGVRDYLIWLD